MQEVKATLKFVGTIPKDDNDKPVSPTRRVSFNGQMLHFKEGESKSGLAIKAAQHICNLYPNDFKIVGTSVQNEEHDKAIEANKKLSEELAESRAKLKNVMGGIKGAKDLKVLQAELGL